MSEYVPTTVWVPKRAHAHRGSETRCDDPDCVLCAESHAHIDRRLNAARAEAITGFVNYLAGRFEDQISLSAAQHMISDYLEGGQ